MWNIPKPSQKIKILIICAIIVVVILAINKFRDKNGEIVAVESFRQTQTEGQVSASAFVDTDGDELPDWQEVITGTDINKKDSDGDGTYDGAELRLGRNPTIPGPEDKEDIIVMATTTTSAEGELTVSDTVARNLFANAIYLSNSGEISEQDKSALVRNLISGIEQSFTYKKYPVESLPTITRATSEQIRFYASTFATLQVGMILQMQKNIASIQKDISVLAQIYANQAVDLYALQVPLEVRDTHLKIVNNYSKGAAVFEAIANEKKDPLKLPFAIRIYQEISVEQPVLIREIGQFVRNSGIIFTQNDVGGYWNAFQ